MLLLLVSRVQHTTARPGYIPGTGPPPGGSWGNGAGVVPGISWIRKHLGTRAGLLPGDLLARFVLGNQNPGHDPAQLPPGELPGDMEPGAVPGTPRIRKHLGTSAGLLPGDLLARFVLGTKTRARPGAIPSQWTTRRHGAWCGPGYTQDQKAPGHKRRAPAG